MFTRAALLLQVLTTVAATYRPTVVLPVSGNVYPDGYYHVSMNIGDPPKEYILDIDTGSDLTWLQCGINDAKTTPTPHDLYKPVTSADGQITQIASCMHHICVSLQQKWVPNCGESDRHCHYEIQYADSGSSLGLLVFENVYLSLTNGTVQTALVAIGCGYDQEFQGTSPFVDGIMGLGNGKAGIINQLESFGVMDNIIGHCFGAQGGGYLAFGNTPLIEDIVWKSVSSQQDHYMLGSAELYFDNQTEPTSSKLQLVFDSGSTYTYFSAQAYEDLLSKIKDDIGTKLEIANDDTTLPVCWKGSQRFTLITDANNYFKSLHLIIGEHGEYARFEMDPESYLILSNHGNLCLGILDGGDVGIGDELSIIGDISMQDKWMIYDNEVGRVGWVAANCSEAPQF